MLTSGFDPAFIPVDVTVDDAMIRVRFESGLELATPVARFPRLQRATPEQRKAWRLIGRGDGIQWPDADEDISMRGLFATKVPRPIPVMEQVPILIGELYALTDKLGSAFKHRPFTPDGHLVGSIGEVVAEYLYELDLEPCSSPAIDARTKEGQTVQIKLTGKNGKAYGVRWTSRDKREQPNFLLCMKLNQHGFEEIYNGPFPTDLLASKPDQSNGQISLSVSSLRRRNPKSLPQRYTYESVNRYFPRQLADVA